MASTGPAGQRAGQAAPTNTANRAVGSRRPVLFLLSSDDGLLIELGPLLGDRYRTRPIDTSEQLEAPTDVPWALLIDATTRNDARAQAARFEQQHPLTPVLVICGDGNAPDWAAARSRGMVSAVVERGSLQSTAFAEALRTMDRQLSSDALDAALAGAPENSKPASGGAKLGLWLSVAVLAAAALAWYFSNGFGGKAGHTNAPASAVTAQPGTTIKPGAAPAAPAAQQPSTAAAAARRRRGGHRGRAEAHAVRAAVRCARGLPRRQVTVAAKR